MQIEIKAEDIERMVREELVKAGLGKVISEGAAKALSGYDNPIDKAIRQYMLEVATRLIRELFAKDIEAALAEAIRKRMTKETVDAIIDATVEKMAKAAAESRY